MQHDQPFLWYAHGRARQIIHAQLHTDHGRAEIRKKRIYSNFFNVHVVCSLFRCCWDFYSALPPASEPFNVIPTMRSTTKSLRSSFKTCEQSLCSGHNMRKCLTTVSDFCLLPRRLRANGYFGQNLNCSGFFLALLQRLRLSFGYFHGQSQLNDDKCNV